MPEGVGKARLKVDEFCQVLGTEDGLLYRVKLSDGQLAIVPRRLLRQVSLWRRVFHR